MALAHTATSLSQDLKAAKDRTSIDLLRFDREIEEQIRGAQKLTTHDTLSGQADQHLTRVKEVVESSQLSREESRLRNEFWDRLIYEVNTRYKNQPAFEFLSSTLTDMAVTRAQLEASKLGNERDYWFFLVNLAVAVKTKAEKIEDIVKFIESYLQYSTITSPKSVSGFRADDGYF
jgi:hypothetical protein